MDKILSLLPEVAVMQDLTTKSKALERDLQKVAKSITAAAGKGNYYVELWDSLFECPGSVQFLLKKKGYKVIPAYSSFTVSWEEGHNV